MICRYSQFRLSSLGTANPKGRLLSHVQRCSGCRDYKEKLAVLDLALSAHTSSAPKPVFPEGRQSGTKTVIFAGVALASVALLLLWMTGDDQENRDRISLSSDDATPDTTSIDTAVGPEGSEPTSLSKTVSLSKIALIHRITPLEHELDAWRDDGKRGLDRLFSLGQK